MRVRKSLLPIAAVILMASTGCDTPDTVSTFCASSNATLASAVPVFQDLQGSCLREINITKGIGTFEAVQVDMNCDAIGKQADGAVAATQVLQDYFTVSNSLATFDTAKSASDASSLISQTGAAVGSSSAAQTALGSIASFITSVATSGYQQKALDGDLIKVSKNIGDVTDALVQILQTNYIGQELKSEDQKLATRYKEFAVKHPDATILLNLDDRWHADSQSIAVKRASAQSLIAALNVIKKGSADLATNAHKVKAKELQGLLDPYVTQLQTLVPQIQKGF